jgi:hypothetical protein
MRASIGLNVSSNRRKPLPPSALERPHRPVARPQVPFRSRWSRVKRNPRELVSNSNLSAPHVLSLPSGSSTWIAVLSPRLGGPATARVATNALSPMLGFGVMLLMLHLAIRPMGVGTGFSLSMLILRRVVEPSARAPDKGLPGASGTASATSLPEG